MLRLICLALLLALPARAQAPGAAPDRVTFGLDWTAQAEYAGFYQAAATGIYARHGLAVTIRQGGPQVNQAQLMLAGRLDFNLTSNGFLALNLAREKLPFTTVAAMFQRDPAVLVAHPGQGHDSFEALRGKPLDADSIAAAADQAAEGTEPPADLNASADYKRHLARVLTRRALTDAAA